MLLAVWIYKYINIVNLQSETFETKNRNSPDIQRVPN